MNEQESILVLCDREEEYARLMSEFLEKQENLPWSVHTYTDVDKMMEVERRADLMVVSEGCYREELSGLLSKQLVVLSESGVLRWKQVRYINKYQGADQVFRELLQLYLEAGEPRLPKMLLGGGTSFLGFYSPMKRCLQTTYALTMAQLLAREHKTLYLNFEYFVGNQELLPDLETRDLADLLYFMNAREDQFGLRLRSMTKQVGELDYIPPMKSGQNLLSVTSGEWLGFLKKLQELGGYEYIIMDLTECMQGLFDILRVCRRVYTICPPEEDRAAGSKLAQYEKLLELGEYGDVLKKTCRCSLPRIKYLPVRIELFSRSELAEYAKSQLRELFQEEEHE